MSGTDQAPAIAWLRAVMADRALPLATKNVLTAVFLRIDWSQPGEYYEGSRALGRRAGLTKETCASNLEVAQKAGWLTRRPHAKSGDAHGGFVYSIATPTRRDGLSRRTRQIRRERATTTVSSDEPQLSRPTSATVSSDTPNSPINHLLLQEGKRRLSRPTIQPNISLEDRIRTALKTFSTWNDDQIARTVQTSPQRVASMRAELAGATA